MFSKYYLSPVTLDETQETVDLMRDEGEDYEEIGKMMKHHRHDIEDSDEGLSVFGIRKSEEAGLFGVIVFVPNDNWYRMLNRPEVQKDELDFNSHIRIYSFDKSKVAVDLVEKELMNRKWFDKNNIVRSCDLSCSASELEDSKRIEKLEEGLEYDVFKVGSSP